MAAAFAANLTKVLGSRKVIRWQASGNLCRINTEAKERGDIRMKKVWKVLGALLAAAAICVTIAVLPTVCRGVSMYHEAIGAKEIATAVQEVRAEDGYAKLDQISDEFISQVIHSEDRRFYFHCGIDPIATARALFHDLQAGAFVEGGSTITQQLAKNLYFSGEKKCERKVAELLVAFDLERKLTKNQILELYCNIAYFGEGCYGIGEAARHYYGVDSGALNASEAKSLVFTLKCPNEYNPNVYQPLAVG